MQTRRCHIRSKTTRRGFTLIELLVVISIIATLMALILPAIQQAREAGRRTQCLNYIRNITLAAVNFAEAHKGVLPASGTYQVSNASATPTLWPSHSWVLELLPYMDQVSVYERWNFNAAFNDGTPGGNGAIGQYNFEVLTCPNDDTAVGKDGGLSYVANCGVGDLAVDVTDNTNPANIGHSFAVEPFDWDGSGTSNTADATITKDTGVFWASFNYPATQSTRNASQNIGRIYDGAGNTIMFIENVNGGQNQTAVAAFAPLNALGTWADPSIRSAGFVLPIVSGSAGPGNFGAMQNIADTTGGSPFINGFKSGPDGAAAYPNSRHIGIVVTAFCDGTARALNENIDRGVYTRLITPNGAKLRPSIPGFYPENPLAANEF